MILVFRNTTEREAAEEAQEKHVSHLQEVDRLKDEFLSVAAHELRTPITSLAGFAQTLLRQQEKQRALEPEGLSRGLHMIVRQAHKLSALVSQLLDVSRIEGGRLTLQRERTDLVRIVEDVASAAQLNADHHEIVVEAPPRAEAFVDPLRIEQVITNLVDNAVADALSGPERAPALFERWRVWLGVAVALIVVGYGPVLVQLGQTASLDSPGVAFWAKPAAATPAAPAQSAPMSGDPARGEQIFRQGVGGAPGCAGCHSIEPDKKSFGPTLAGIATRAGQIVAKPAYSGQARTAPDFLREVITDPDVYVTEGYPKGAMYRDYGKQFTMQQMDDLVSYLMTLR